MLDSKWWSVALALGAIQFLALIVAFNHCADCTADDRCSICSVGDILTFPVNFLFPFLRATPSLRPAILILLPANSFLWGCVLAEPVRWWFGWPPWRFSLRTMLIAMTLVAAVLGLAGYAFH